MKTKKLISFFTICFLSISTLAFAQDATKVYSVEEIIAEMPNLVGQTISVKGVAEHVCAESGRKIFLQTTDKKRTVQVSAAPWFGKFNPKAVGEEVIATGVVFEFKTTLDKLEKQLEAVKKVEAENKEGDHCNSEAKAAGENIKLKASERVQANIDKLKKQIADGGKDYLSSYSIFKCESYRFGKNLNKTYSVEEIIAQMPDLVGQGVTVKGVAQHVCAESGMKIFLLSTDKKKTVQITAAKAFGKFDPKAVGKMVTATGTVYENQTTLEKLEQQLEVVKKAESEKKEDSHCNSEAKAAGENVKLSATERIQAKIDLLKKQIADGGKNYLSSYSILQCNACSFE